MQSTTATAPSPRASTAGAGYLPPSLTERPDVRVDRTLRAFLGALAYYAKGLKDTCFPSVARIAHDIGCCPGHVRRQIRKAVALGLIALVPVAWNRCKRVFKLLWKPDLEVDPRAPAGGYPLPERPGPAPYPSAKGRSLRRAPGDVQGSLKGEDKNAGGVGMGSESPPPPPAPEPEPTPEALRTALAAGRAQARARQAAAPPPPAGPPVSPRASMRKAGPDPAQLAAALAELQAHKARREAAAAPSGPTAAPNANPANGPRGWLLGWLRT
jgi:Helix-turn-helix domain